MAKQAPLAKLLRELHIASVKELLARIKGEVKDADGNPIPATAAELAVAAKLLRDSNVCIDLDREEAKELAQAARRTDSKSLREALPMLGDEWTVA